MHRSARSSRRRSSTGSASTAPNAERGPRSRTSLTCWRSLVWCSRTGGGEDEAVAALLHDAVEDQGGRERLEDIRERFGGRVASIVEGCTEWIRERHQTDADKPTWRERKEAYLNRLAAETDDGIIRVSLADKLHNLRTIISDVRSRGSGIFRRFNASAREILWYYQRLADTFPDGACSSMKRELVLGVSELERFVPSEFTQPRVVRLLTRAFRRLVERQEAFTTRPRLPRVARRSRVPLNRGVLP